MTRPWPRPLPRPDPAARAATTVTGLALRDPGRCAEAAARWARLLELPVAVTSEPGPPSRLPAATAGLVWPDGAAGRLRVDAHLVAGVLERLAGRPGVPVGPAPLSPAEEGLFAYLALAWCALLPPPRPRLAWIHGGDPAWPVPGGGAGAVTWRLDVDGRPGAATWWLPDRREPPASAPASDVPVPLHVVAGPLPVAVAPLAAGTLLPLPPGAGPRLRAGPLSVCALSLSAATLTVAGPASEVAMAPPGLESLPVTLTVEIGALVLPAGEVAALRPGQVLPLPLADPPVVTLRAGDRIVAVGVLVDDDGQLAVQLTRTT